MSDLSSVLSGQVAASVAAQAKADEAKAEAKVKATAKRVDAAIRGTGQHTVIAISGGVGSALGAGLLALVRHFL